MHYLRIFFGFIFVFIAYNTFAKDISHKSIIGKTILFVNNTDRVPQVEYLDPNGNAAVWTAAFGAKVVPAKWYIEQNQANEEILCLIFLKEAINTATDLKLCDKLSNIKFFIHDQRMGDIYNLMSLEPRLQPLPPNVQTLSEVDALLGR